MAGLLRRVRGQSVFFKTIYFSFLLFFFFFLSFLGQTGQVSISVFEQTGRMNISAFKQTGPAKGSSVDRTAIRSVVAQGGELRLLVHVGVAGVYELNIYSADGEIVYRQTIQEQPGEVEQNIVFGGHGHGVYVVDLIGAGSQSTKQVM